MSLRFSTINLFAFISYACKTIVRYPLPLSPHLDRSLDSPLISNSDARLKILVESPENVEMGGKIDSVKLCFPSTPKAILRYITYFLTCGIMYLFNIWVPSLHIKMTYVECEPEEATWVVVYGAGNTSVINKSLILIR